MGESNMGNDGTTQSAEGCWTCRLRRKKCDRHAPICYVCSALLITCYYTPEKPEWVDGGERQREMAEQLKQEVRDKAPYRRSLAYAKAMNEPKQEMQLFSLPEPHSGDLEPVDPPSYPPQDAVAVFFPTPEHRNTLPSSLRFPGTGSVTPSATSRSLSSQHASDPVGLDRGLVVCYLDFYFPFLFPFYQPSMLDRGRAWVVDFITDSQAMEQTTLSLSSYFFSLALDMTNETAHKSCRKVAWEKLLSKIHGTFGLLRDELQSLTMGDISEHLPRAVQIMGCILLLQRFETAIFSFDNCEAHLNAAIELFKHVLEGSEAAAACDPSGWPSRFASVMRQLRGHGPPWLRQFPTFQAPSSEQMAFRFFSALLLVDDIIASTALGEEPKLYQFHDSILGNGQWQTWKDEQAPYTIQLESIMGCQNWAMVAVARISALDAWKKRQKAAGDLDVMELALRAAGIKSVLVASLTRIEVSPPAVPAETNESVWGIFTPSNGQASAMADQSLLATRIWAHAAILYLSVVVSGWQPSSSEVRHHVACIVELLSQRILSWAVLRTIAWPFCVAGCLAGPTQEPLFGSIVGGLRPPGLLGPLQKALHIMEVVWRRRDLLDSNTWDIAACFQDQGYLVLLV